MKIGEAQSAYSKQIQAYNQARNELYAQKEELNKRIFSTPNGAVIYQNEAAVLELQYNAVDQKRQEYQDYMDKLLEQKAAVWNSHVAEQQGDAMAEAVNEEAKVMTVARRIMNGDKVPAKDERKLMEYDYKLYSMDKNAAAMLEFQERRKVHKSLWEDEEEVKEIPDIEGMTDNTEAFADGPEIVEVSEVIASE